MPRMGQVDAGAGTAGPPPRFADVYDEEVWAVYGFFGYRVPTRELAEDMTQLTFENALRAWGRYDPSRGSPRTWLMAIARNVLADHYRRDRLVRHEPVPDDDAGVAALGTEPPPEPAGLAPDLER